MKITIENYRQVPKKERKKLYALLIDLEEMNNLLEKLNLENRKLYIDWQDYHDEYSDERVDPCPDYYGFYRLKFEDNQLETVGVEMNIDTLDIVLCSIINLLEYNE